MKYEELNSKVIEYSHFISYISDMETYELLHLTKAAMDLYGMKGPEEYLGKKCYQVVMGLEQPCPFCTNDKIREGREYRWERYNENINRWFDRKSSVIDIEGRPCHLEVGQDITARKEELSLLSGKLTMEDVLFRCLNTLTREKNLDTAVKLFLEALGGYHKADRAYIFELDYENKVVNSTFEWYKPGMKPRGEIMKDIPLDWVEQWNNKLEQEGELCVVSVEKEVDPNSMLYKEFKEDGVTSFMMVALKNGDTLEGILGVNNPKQEAGNPVLLHSVAEFVRVELEKRHMIRELEYLSYTDTLTGLKNRNNYNKVLKKFERKSALPMGIVLMDINGLRKINENYGDSYGDHMIRKVGGILSSVLTGEIFRIGGDEFVVLWENIDFLEFRKQMISLREALEKEQDCVVSMGCIWEEKEEDIHILLQQAAERLSADKQSYYQNLLREGRNDTCTGVAAEVIREVKEGSFIVHYQPQVDIQTGKITGAEALVRKKEGDGGLIPPSKFIPFYEMEGVVSYIDLFVMKTACRDMKQWNEEGHKIHMSINFSRVTLLESGIVNILKEICEDYKVSPSQITIEVTESISKMGHAQLKELIKEMNQAGFTISLDDFGSQYSNLSILSDMEFDEIKFDKSLIEDLEYNPKSRIVMENTVNMCRQLQGTSLAEGIETKGQLKLLMDYNCNYGQGFYFSKPVPKEMFADLLKNELKEK